MVRTTGQGVLKNHIGSKEFWLFRKGRMVRYFLLTIGLFLSVQVMMGYAESVELPDEQKQAEPEKKKDAKPRGRWLPIPIPITEPAIGFGLGVALGYIHPAKDHTETEGVSPVHSLKSASSVTNGQKAPPAITGVGAAYTASGTWAAAVAHSDSWRNDTIRYAGALVHADVYSEFYVLDRPLDFNLQLTALYQDLKFRMGKSRFFLGGKLLMLATESQFDITIGETEIPIGDIQSNNIGLAATASFDGRDNTFTPDTGQLLELIFWRFDEGLGGDYNYWRGNFKVLSFHQLHPRFVLGLRLEATAVDGRPPFYAYPWVSMRGIPAMRYQGEGVAEFEVEARWDITHRWGIVGFAGTGAVGGDDPSFRTKDSIYSGGVGVRYFMMRDLGLWLGVDVARGPEDWYTYITIGQAW